MNDDDDHTYLFIWLVYKVEEQIWSYKGLKN